MKLSKLFKRAVTGKILEWEVEVKDGCYRTISGYTDGLKVTSEWTCCEAKNVGKKNATTAEEQAEAEAQAMHRKRIEMGSFTDISNIDKPTFFKPMLANDYNDYKDKIEFPIYSQPKLDGVRCIVKADGMWTRNGKRILSAPHIFNALRPLFEANPFLILDGELYAQAEFNKIISCVRKSKPTAEDLRISAGCIEYWIYDIPSVDGEYKLRYYELCKMQLPSCCILLPTDSAHSHDEINELYADYVGAGYEGQMLRTNTPYECKRTKALLKHKSFVDAEFEIKGVVEGKGNMSGKVGKLQFHIDGKLFEAGVNGDWEYLEQLLKRDDLVGKTATVKYFELTEDGIPRFPKVVAIRDFE